MGFSNQERINLHSKILTAGVKDANEVAQWYEAIFPNNFVSRGDKVWTDPDLSVLLANPAVNLAAAQANVAGPLSSFVDDFSLPANAIRLTVVPGTNNSTYAAFSVYGDLSSQQLDNWLQPQFIPQSNKIPSYGYSVRLFNGNPNSGGVEIYPADGATGTGVNKTVGWVFDYANGILLLSADFRASITNPYILGFRYTGTTANSGAISGQAGGDLDGTYPNPSVVAATFNGDQLLFNTTIEDGYLLQRIGNQVFGFDPTVISVNQGLSQVLGITNTTDGIDIDLTDGSVIKSPSVTLPVEMYVDDASGNDINDGSSGTPLKTITEAVRRIGVTGVMSDTKIYVAQGTYNIEALSRITDYKSKLTIIGQSSTVVVPSITVQSVAEGIKVTFTPDPGWTNDQHAGKHLECLTATNAGNVGSKKTIIKNTSDTLWLASPCLSPILAGDTFRIIRPSTVFTAPGVNYPIIGGGRANEYFEPFENPGLTIVNVEFNCENDGVWFSRFIRFFGICFRVLNNGFGYVIFGDGDIKAGLQYPSDLSAISVNSGSSFGWGLSSVVDGAASSGVGLTFSNSTALGSFACSWVYAMNCNIWFYSLRCNSSNTQLAIHSSNVTLDKIQVGSLYSKHVFDGTGAISNVNHSILTIIGRLEQTAGTGHLMVFENSEIVIDPPDEPIILGQVIAQGNGATVRISNITGSLVVQGFRAGRQIADIITQATFSPNEMISGGGALIERTV